ncbi:MAG: hypothetical protein H6710_19075 [Myxococcales bacterium]|nr:hypothetical protein [Myxococcales bacterium]
MPTIDPAALEAFRKLRLDEGDLGGEAIDDAAKVQAIDNGVSTIRFFDADALGGGATPHLRAEPSPVADPSPRSGLIAADPALAGDPAAFAARLAAVIAANQDHLRPAAGSIAGLHTRFQYNAVVGQRIAALTEEATAAANALYSAGPARDQALYAVHTAIFDLYSRELEFDEFEIKGYGSFGHDAAFIHAWELRLAELAKVDERLLSDDQRAALARERAQLQAELDAIFRDKYVYNSDRMFEVNAEISIGLCLIDVASRQRVSETAASLNSLVPAYELLSVAGDGDGARRPVYFDALEGKHYFDGSDEVVGDDALATLRRTPLAADAALTFRRAASGEHLRKNFRFDWNGDGYVDKARIDWVSWGGHCNDKANLESHGVVIPEGDEGVVEYDSAAGSTAHYTRDLLNEILLSLSELDTRMIDPRSGRRQNLSKDEFAGARDDDRPDRIVLGPNLTIPFRDRPNELEITEIATASRTYRADEIFRPKLVADDQRSADDNPLYVGTEEGDRVTLDLSGAVVHLALRLQVFDPSGYPTMMRREVTLDFKDPPAEPVFIDTVLKDAGAREIYEISLDLKGRRWLAQLVRMEAQGQSYRAVDVGEPIVRTFDPAALRGQREVSLDDPALYMPFVKEALQTGRNFTSETEDGAGVWNGRTKRLAQRTLWRDDQSRWAKVQVEVEARYGGNVGAFLVKHRADGKPDHYVPLALPFDFAWRTDVAFAPVLGDMVNEKALERGVISAVGGRYSAEALTSLCELLHAAFSGRRHLINHQGRRYAFATRGAWEAARARLEGMRRRALGEEIAPEPSAIVTLLEVSGQVERKASVQHQVVAEASGPVTIILDTRSGDADLYVNLGAPATNEDGGHALLSDNFGLRRELIEIPEVAAGTLIGVAVHGYKASEYTLTISGPRPGAAPAPRPEPIAVALHGVVQKGEEQHLAPITAVVAGELEITLSGSGDADIYVAFGRPPTTTQFAWRLYGPTSNERGRLAVRAGDVVHVMVHGYAARSEFDLSVRSV